ncbi:MAG: hypothetical protein RSF82_06960 [Angelakisella sp.]
MKFVTVTLILVGTLLFYSEDLSTWLKTTQKVDLRQKLRLLQQHLEKSRMRSLRQKLQQLEAGSKENFVTKSYNTMSAILSATGDGDKIRQMKYISVACGTVGVAISIYVGSYMLAPILGVGLALLPMWLIKFKAYRFNVMVMNELSVVLSMITNSYIRCENIVKAISENSSYMNEPVKSHFEWFVKMSTTVSADIAGNLEALKKKMDNPIFQLWCDCLIICQKDINQKYSLNAVVEQFTNDRELLNLLSSEVSKPIKVFATVVVGTMLAFPLTAMLGTQLTANGDALGILFSTFWGQCLVVGYVIVLLFGINRAIDLSTKM